MAVISFKCPNCDGELIFEPSTQKYKCPYCMSLFSQEELDEMKPAEASEKAADASAGAAGGDAEMYGQQTEDGNSGAGAQSAEMHEKAGAEQKEPGGAADKGAEAVMYSCPSCGAEIVTDKTTAATFCYYCHNPVVLGSRLEGKFLPDRVIPFEVTKEAATKGFLDYVGKKKFVPKAFFNKKQIESMTGVYFPYWVYDVNLDGKMQGDARNVRVWRTGDIEYTETKHYAVEREGEIALSNLTENALKKANAKLAEGVMPYQFEKMKKFNMGYLSGFLAERRDIEKTEVQGKMQAEMREDAEKLLRETISGYNSVSVRNTNLVPKKEMWHYALFPVWTITYKAHNGKIYYYSMNGQTGKVCGELPVDYGKAVLTSVLTALGILVLGLIGGFFL